VLLVLDRAPPAAMRQRLDGLVCLATSEHEPRLSLWLGWPVSEGHGGHANADARRSVPTADGECPRRTTT
jgi:hypothetical protein